MPSLIRIRYITTSTKPPFEDLGDGPRNYGLSSAMKNNRELYDKVVFEK